MIPVELETPKKHTMEHRVFRERLKAWCDSRSCGGIKRNDCGSRYALRKVPYGTFDCPQRGRALYWSKRDPDSYENRITKRARKAGVD